MVDHYPQAKLELNTNRITTVPVELQLKLATVEGLHVSLLNNELSSPPLGFSGGPGSLRAYLRDLASQPCVRPAYRLMLVGFGGVGKTTFSRALRSTEEDLASFSSGLAPLPS
jgi:hypothetical protein